MRAAVVRRQFDPAMVLFRKALHERKTETAALCLGRKKRLENFRGQILGYAGTGIMN
jgi:hypothetical protein